MLRITTIITLVSLIAGAAFAQSRRWDPTLGYLYPAGGKRGEVIKIIAGGQYLKNAKSVHVTGKGVTASVVKHYRPVRNLNGDQRKLLKFKLAERRAVLTGKPKPTPLPTPKPTPTPTPTPNGSAKEAAKKAKPKKPRAIEVPPHPLLEDINSLTLKQLDWVTTKFMRYDPKRQPNAQIGEMVMIEVTIDKDAPLGARELRLASHQGMTNPIFFQVGYVPEVREQEPNDPGVDLSKYGEEKPILPPKTLNGQILPGDVDRFKLRARKGQNLVIETQARSLIPYLADAVPGWFQMTVALYDSKGREVAFADDYHFNPDPVLFFKVPENGIYELEIRDSIYRGRQDFVYRVTIGEKPFITAMFPLGGQISAETVPAKVMGWNLPKSRIYLDARPGGDNVRYTGVTSGPWRSNAVPYHVSTIPTVTEDESNDTMKDAQEIKISSIVNGLIVRPGDVDIFKFKGRKDQEIVAEVLARRLNSPLDSSVKLVSPTGNVLAWNDDYMPKEGHLHTGAGWLTHHADSYLRKKLPADGIYYIRLEDSQRHGSVAHGYRLRISTPRPGFQLRATPSCVNMRGGQLVPVHVYAQRRDGFDGEIEVTLGDSLTGFQLHGGRIPAGQTSVSMTLEAPIKPPGSPLTLEMTGSAVIGRQTVTEPVVGADNRMQAFLWRHLVPSKQFIVSMDRRRGWKIGVRVAGDMPVRIPAGGTAQLEVKAPPHLKERNIQLELDDPPPGLAVSKISPVPEGFTVLLSADQAKAEPGRAGNLILQAFADAKSAPKKGNPARQQNRQPLGFLPAVPYEVVQR